MDTERIAEFALEEPRGYVAVGNKNLIGGILERLAERGFTTFNVNSDNYSEKTLEQLVDMAERGLKKHDNWPMAIGVSRDTPWIERLANRLVPYVGESRFVLIVG